MSARKILVIEDDAAIRRGIIDALEFAGEETLEAADAPSGLEKAVRLDYDLLLLDLQLPRGDGLEILKTLRASRPTVPVIILTARGSEDDRVKGLKLGADDYVVKPFSVRELLARVGAVLRRSAERPVVIESVPVTNGTVDLKTWRVAFSDGSEQTLSEREAELLHFLAANPERAISRSEILERVWRMDSKNIETRAVDMQIARLREKIRDDADAPAVIITVRGKGYQYRRPV